MFNKLKNMQITLKKKYLWQDFCEVESSEGFEWLKTNCPQVAVSFTMLMDELKQYGRREVCFILFYNNHLPIMNYQQKRKG